MTDTPYRWSEREQRYRGPNGRFIPAKQVRTALDRALTAGDLTARSLSVQLQQGQINLATWQVGMERMVKQSHLSAASAAKGGWAQMSQADFGRAGQRIREQYRYLANYASEIQSGKQVLDGRFLVRSELYTEAARGTFHATERRAMEALGMDEERNILGAADHCGGCVGEDARGWVQVGALVPIGGRTCRTRCRCRIGYRNSLTGETRP